MMIHFMFSYLSTVAFAILINLPRRILLSSGFTGAIGWVVFISMRQAEQGITAANFMGGIAIGCLSILFSRWQKVPVLVVNVPALVPLVPGGPAYKAVREFVTGDYFAGFEQVMIVLMTSGAIAAAFMMTSLIERLITKYRQRNL